MSPKSPEEFEQMRAESRRNILNSALQLFAEQGYEQTSVSDIADHASISKGLLYNYFESKNHLLHEVVNEGFKLMPEIFVADEDCSKSPEIASIFQQLKQSLQEDQLFWRFYVELLLQVLRNDQLAREFQEEYHTFVHLFIRMMESAGVEQPELEGRKLAALLDGISLHYMFDDEYPLDEMFDYLTAIYSKSHADE